MMTEQKYDILMLYRGMNVGGIETLILRLSKCLLNDGYNVIVATSYGPLSKLIDPRVTYIELPSDLYFLSVKRLVSNKLSIERPLLALSFDPCSRFLTEFILQHINKSLEKFSAIHLSGCFHPRAYFYETEKRWHHLLNGIVARAIGHSGLYFMNRVCRQNHVNALGLKPHENNIIFLPVNIAESTWSPPSHEYALRIIAVGRIVVYKAYNFGLLDCAESFAKKGININISIFGYGEDYNKLEQEIKLRNLGSVYIYFSHCNVAAK